MAASEMSRPTLRRDDELLILDLGDDENLLDGDRVARLHQLLDDIEQTPPPCALVTTASGRHWQGGADLTWMFESSTDELALFAQEVHRLYARLLILPMVSVAAITGHVVANGVALALCHDYRVMRSGRGFWYLPNIDAGYPFSWGEISLMRAKVSCEAVLKTVLTGRRLDALEARALGLIDTATDSPPFPVAAELARPLARKNRVVLDGFKHLLFENVVTVLCGPQAARAAV